LVSIDQDLIFKAQSGNESAFASIVSASAPRVFSLIRRVVWSEPDVEDLAQEVFIRLYRNLPRFTSGRALEPWLYRVALNLSVDHLRKLTSRGHSVDITRLDESSHSDHTPDTLFAMKEKQQRLVRLMQKLSRKQQRVLVLRDLENFTVEEIASIINCRQSTVRVHLARARLKLRGLIEQQAPDLLK
jgi:RNA polymerase sigma-70 factor (ECF subfamily)